METMFSVTNGGSFDISRKHQILCETTLAVSRNNNIVTGAVSAYVNGHWMLYPTPITQRIPASGPLRAGGDAQTDPCLAWIKFEEGLRCVDMTVIFWYSLETQPDFEQEKRFRFVAYSGPESGFVWYSQPVASTESYCARFIKQRPTP